MNTGGCSSAATAPPASWPSTCAGHPRPVPLHTLVTVAGSRWSIEELFQTGKGQVGLDHYQVRGWTGWHRFVTLAMLALAVLTILAATAAARHRPGDHRADRRRDPPTPQRLRPRRTASASAHPALVNLATNIPSPSPTIPLPAQTGQVTLEY